MPRQTERASQDKAVDFGVLVGRYFTWLGRLFLGRSDVGDYKITGFSVRLEGVGAFVVVRGFDMVRVENVVCFGRGDNLYLALRNATLAIEKKSWKQDKYAPFLP